MSTSHAPALQGIHTGIAAPVIVVEAHPLVREGLLRRVQAALPNSVVVYSGDCIREAADAALRRGCAFALVDLEVETGTSPANVITTFTQHGIPVLAVTTSLSEPIIAAAMTAGASGVVGKLSDPNEIDEAIGSIVSGGTSFPLHRLSAYEPGNTVVELSERERCALTLYVSGMTQDSVARRMGIASSTVKHYLDRARRKYNEAGFPARTKLELNELARNQGLLP